MCRSYLSPFLVSDDFMFLQYDKWKTLEWTNEERGSHGYSGQFIPIACILNRRTNHVRMIQTTPIRAEGLSSLLISRKPYCLTANNELVYVERVVSLKETAATYQDTNELTSSERRFIKQLPMDGNPVLFLLPLKPF